MGRGRGLPGRRWQKGWAAIGEPQTKAEGGGAPTLREQRGKVVGQEGSGRSAQLREEILACWTEGEGWT